jgi:hypothetical protein
VGNFGGPSLASSSHRSGTARTSGLAGSPIKVLDHFTRAGGLTLGFHQASERFKVGRAVESKTALVATHDRTELARPTCHSWRIGSTEGFAFEASIPNAAD